MLTLRAAATLLAQADSLVALRPILHVLGYASSRRVPGDTSLRLGIDTYVTETAVARGQGPMRCLTAVLASSVALHDATKRGLHAGREAEPDTTADFLTDPRDITRRLCVALAANAPLRDWCVITLDAKLATLCIALVMPHPHGTRVVALRVDRHRVVDSDADALRSLAAIEESEPMLRTARMADILGRDALSARFYRALQLVVAQMAETATGKATPVERRELALLYVSRCLFLAFLEAKAWLNNDRQFLLHHITECLERGRNIHQQLLRPLFFGTLNTPRSQRASLARAFGSIPFLNGGLFAPTPLEQRCRTLRFTNDALTALIGDLFDRYRFTAHEDSTAWSEAAIDPEMLGRAFESLMAANERHQTGTYYTPPALVTTVVADALCTAFPDLPADALHDAPTPLVLSDNTRKQLTAIRILDPACGSGAFLVHTLERIANIHARAGDQRPLHDIRRSVLTNSIFGVDQNPMAVWLCELRLWLSMVIECPETDVRNIPPLPNLDHHIRVGDSLAGGNFRYAPVSARQLTNLRDRYTRATGVRKRSLALALDRDERHRAVTECRRMTDAVQHERRALLDRLRTRDLFGQRNTRTTNDRKRLLWLRQHARTIHTERRKLELGGALPFRFAAHFADVAAEGGFPIVLGNPPWVRPHALTSAARTQLRQEFASMKGAAWRTGAARAGAGAGFAAQADIAVAFVERSGQLLAPNGVMALLVPAKLWRTLSGGGIRQWLHDHVHVRSLHDWSHAPALFNAAVYPSLVVAERPPVAQRPIAQLPMTPPPIAQLPTRTHTRLKPRPQPRPLVRVTINSHRDPQAFSIYADSLTLDGDAAAPWLLLPTDIRAAFEQFRLSGPALGDSSLGRPTLGVKCGCNAAFIVQATEHDDDLATVTANGRRSTIERQMLRPALRGEGVAKRHAHTLANEGDTRIIWTHAADGTPLRSLPPATMRWLAQWRHRLEQRRDARARQPWWTLFRTDSARFDTARVVWADIAKQLHPQILPAGDPTVPLNSCYVLRTPATEDAWAASAILASPLAAAWFSALAEPARGGFRRYLGWTVATLPVPREWNRVRTPLAEFAKRHAAHPNASTHEYLELISMAYGMPVQSFLPLIHWSAP